MLLYIAAEAVLPKYLQRKDGKHRQNKNDREGGSQMKPAAKQAKLSDMSFSYH